MAVVPAAPKAAVLPTQAQVIVQVPADAKLYVDGQLSQGTSGTRTLVSPQLESGKDYFYSLKVEAVRNGQTVTQSKDVIVRAGQTSQVDFNADLARAQNVAHISVHLPTDARLYVNGVLCPQTSSTREFDTPELRPGQKYAYTFKAEAVRDGRTESVTRDVVFEAGKQVNVDFGSLTALNTVQR